MAGHRIPLAIAAAVFASATPFGNLRRAVSVAHRVIYMVTGRMPGSLPV